MNGKDLRKVRTLANMTQAQAAEALGVSANYVSILERSDEPIDGRMEKLIEALLLPRIDVSFSDALNKWVVAITTPARTVAGRRHNIIAAKDTLAAATQLGNEEWDKTGNLAMFIIRQPDGRLERR